MALKFSIVIPNWNGKDLLEKNLPSVLKTKAQEVIVSDDGSTDGSGEFLEEKYPEVKVILHQRVGFAENCNLGVKEAKGEIVVLLNTDVVPKEDFLKFLEEDFKDSGVFAVSLGEPQWSWARGFWQKGYIEHEPGERTKEVHPSFWASGGSGAFRKSLWEKLGGFDRLYHPFYWEDIDLSYRAAKRGYKILWDPRSVVHHQHQGTIGQFSKKAINEIAERNRLLFIWKNILPIGMILEHKCHLFLRLLTHFGYWRPFFKALVRLPLIIPRRIKEYQEEKVSDREIFSKFSEK